MRPAATDGDAGPRPAAGRIGALAPAQAWTAAGSTGAVTTGRPPAPGAQGHGHRRAADAARVLWPVAVLALLHTGVRAATGPARDLHILWSAGARLVSGDALYDAERAFIYPPVAGWALAPLSALPFRAACVVMTVLSLASLVTAVVLLLRVVGVPWTSPVTPAVLLALALARPVVGLLDQGNVDVLLVLAQVVVIRALVDRRDGLAAGVLGTVCAVKPTLAPLLAGALLLGHVRVAVRAGVVAVALTVLGLVAVPDARVFVADVLPLLADGNRAVLHPWDRSLRGAVEQLGLPAVVGLVARVGVLLLAVAVAWRRRGAPLAPLEVMPLMLLGGLLASSFSWANYSLYLLPLLVTVALAGSVVRTWPSWVAVYLLWSAQAWPAPAGHGLGDTLVGLRPTWGWLLLLVTCAWVAWRDGDRAPGRRPPGSRGTTTRAPLGRPSRTAPA